MSFNDFQVLSGSESQGGEDSRCTSRNTRSRYCTLYNPYSCIVIRIHIVYQLCTVVLYVHMGMAVHAVHSIVEVNRSTSLGLIGDYMHDCRGLPQCN